MSSVGRPNAETFASRGRGVCRVEVDGRVGESPTDSHILAQPDGPRRSSRPDVPRPRAHQKPLPPLLVHVG